jgi:alpha-glucoside transport system permease protein|tara:strand:- start:325 stop:1482 length:1158 start_codon:yes stop_codon:yes gene_type:complete
MMTRLKDLYLASPLRLLTHFLLIILVVAWTFPTLGLFVSSFRSADEISSTGWWSSLSSSSQNKRVRLGEANLQELIDGKYVISGELLSNESTKVINFGDSFNNFLDNKASTFIKLKDSSELMINENGSYRWTSENSFSHKNGKRVFINVLVEPNFSFDNYDYVLFSEGLGKAFLNTLTVTIPATIIPILLAAFASYAFSWMDFPGRKILFIVIVGLLVVPLQMSLIPLLSLYSSIGAFLNISAKSYPGVWLAHTAFALPLAIYLLRNYMVGIPKEIIESARVEGASHFQIFSQLVLPLSLPALASFAIFQFLWVWNDLLVSIVFLGSSSDQVVMTTKLRQLMGTYGGDYQILTASAFVTIIVPLLVFLGLQKYFVKGLVAGSVKE